MRIDLNVRSTEVNESSRSGGSNGVSKQKQLAKNAAQPHGDEAQLSSSAARIRELERVASKTPEVRNERVESLRAAIRDGRYQPPTEHVSHAMLLDALARTELMRR